MELRVQFKGGCRCIGDMQEAQSRLDFWQAVTRTPLSARSDGQITPVRRDVNSKKL